MKSYALIIADGIIGCQTYMYKFMYWSVPLILSTLNGSSLGRMEQLKKECEMEVKLIHLSEHSMYCKGKN